MTRRRAKAVGAAVLAAALVGGAVLWWRSRDRSDCAYAVVGGRLFVVESANGWVWFGLTDDTSDPVWGRPELPRKWDVYSFPFDPPGEHVAGNVIFSVIFRRQADFSSQVLGLSYYAPRARYGGNRFAGLFVRYRTVLLALGIPAASMAATWALRRARRSRRRRRGLCVSCGYDLRGIADRCPECGAEIDRAGEAAGAS